ncbi:MULTISPECIES: DUF998 domain-containing protein [Stenotrophomonas]|jgi:hypothetical protein|uniref:DUF998 domain-containing protein n=2 Tax=Stenotrophomonas TaxID=40323 RepID=A0A4S2D7C2_STEMA|nr:MULTISPECIES: DUF998 domain-containing protein [Stenotrophomonas]MBD3827566.1 DUF998 domain-containing protein [Stenotrophomonas sp.]QIO89011.1 membrane protein [Stenotrophomonas rhizophila]TGY37366.1 DUF998 domain-containing protein [Stenotrophomonas maltophilia]HBS61514.1 DUF998 domain-containing protein [Stenotrophomonas sp.]
MQAAKRWEQGLGAAAAAVFVLAATGFALALPAFDPMRHPLALLGALGVPHGRAFSLVTLLLPGLLAAGVAFCLLLRVPRTAPWPLRVGVQMLMLAALAFAAMGLLPLDADDIDSMASRYHASAWMVWVLAFVPGALMTAGGAWSLSGWRRAAQLHLAGGTTVLLAAFVLPALLPGPLAQLLAFGGWLVWLAAALPLAPAALRP